MDNQDTTAPLNKWEQSSQEVISQPSGPWGHETRRYEYFESTEVPGVDQDGLAPRDAVLENMLFHLERPSKGINFGKYEGIKVHLEVTKENTFQPIKLFDHANLHAAMRENIKLCGYREPTPIQAYSVPCILAGHDLLAGAQTGSGKTAAFLIPIISRLMGKADRIQQPRTAALKRAEPLVLIIAPTRELATQIFDECRRFCYRSKLRPCVVYGGVDMRSQTAELQKGCDLLVASPGRLQDYARRGTLAFSRVRFVVLDEADRLISDSQEMVKEILSYSDLPNDDSLQICMYSATFPRSVRDLATEHLSDYHVKIRIGRLGATTTDITQRISWVEPQDKLETLENLLLDQPPTRTAIFVNTKRQCDAVDDFLFNKRFPVTSIHGDRTQREREDALSAFRTGLMPILVATDVAARGIDIKGVMHVINYDCPKTIEEYVHRIGRTARIGNMGLATTFFNDRDEIGDDLTRVLIENDQELPDFLEQFRPEGELRWEEDDDVPITHDS